MCTLWAGHGATLWPKRLSALGCRCRTQRPRRGSAEGYTIHQPHHPVPSTPGSFINPEIGYSMYIPKLFRVETSNQEENSVEEMFGNRLRQDFYRAQVFLTNFARSSGLPWFHSYPINSCEAASSYLAVALARRYPDLAVSVVKGSGSKGNHFWVEADGYVMDLTIDPFNENGCPIFDCASHPSSHLFSSLGRDKADAAWKNFGTGSQVFLEALLKFLDAPDPHSDPCS